VVVGLILGLAITIAAVVAKIGFFVNSPRAAHGFILVAFFVIPAIAGAAWGLRSGRAR
jgi:hypothetical protein